MTVKRLTNERIQYEDANNALANGYRLFFYAAGSATKQNTYNSSAGTVANTNPIVLNALGEPAVEIWLTAGQTYKMGLAIPGSDDPPASFVWSEDNITGVNDTSVAGQDEWIAPGLTPTYVSATSFTLSGDQTTAFHVGRRLKSTVTAGTSYGTITASVFGALTTITVDTTGSNPLDAGLSAVSYGLMRADNFTQSIGMDHVARQSSDIVSAATINLDAAGGDLVDVTGVVAITAITLARGKSRTVRFTGALTLTNGASLVLPGGANITTAAGDFAIFRGYAGGVVRCVTYSKISAAAGKQPTRTTLTSGTGTYTTPTGATRIEVTAVGPGSGGVGGNGASSTAAGNTTFSTLTATGGAASIAAGSGAQVSNVATGGDVNASSVCGQTGILAIAASSGTGMNGGATFLGGAGTGTYNSTGSAAAANTGSGGGGGASSNSTTSGSGGHSGSWCFKRITSPAATYSYAVGAGTAGTAAGAGGGAGGAGGSGLIWVDEYYN